MNDTENPYGYMIIKTEQQRKIDPGDGFYIVPELETPKTGDEFTTDGVDWYNAGDFDVSIKQYNQKIIGDYLPILAVRRKVAKPVVMECPTEMDVPIVWEKLDTIQKENASLRATSEAALKEMAAGSHALLEMSRRCDRMEKAIHEAIAIEIEAFEWKSIAESSPAIQILAASIGYEVSKVKTEAELCENGTIKVCGIVPFNKIQKVCEEARRRCSKATRAERDDSIKQGMKIINMSKDFIGVIGWWGVPGAKRGGGMTHIIKAGTRTPMCKTRIHPNAEFHFCSHISFRHGIPILKPAEWCFKTAECDQCNDVLSALLNPVVANYNPRLHE